MLALACAGTELVGTAPSRPRAKVPAPPSASASAGSAPVPSSTPATPAPGPNAAANAAGRDALAKFQGFLKEQGDLDYPDLVKRLGLGDAAESKLTFDPTKVRYFDRIERELSLTEDERRIFREHGVVSVDHHQSYSMASAYYAIYTRDLPLFVSTDSILHAFHRSFDEVLETFEAHVLSYVIDSVLARASEGLPTLARDHKAIRPSVEDVDLYLTVARNLLAGAGGSAEDAAAEAARGRKRDKPPEPTSLLVQPRVVDPRLVKDMLEHVASLALEVPDAPCPERYGGRRCVDWSQFRPRGHYTHSQELRRYFRTMMWLGRADLGFYLRPPDEVSGLEVDVPREQRNAALLLMLLKQSGERGRLGQVSGLIDFLVGSADNVTLEEVSAALARAGIKNPAGLGDQAALSRFDAALDTVGVRAQQIRSQVLDADAASKTPTALPLEFQVFGQRFVIDSFALAGVVYDSIVYEGEKQHRYMPSGLDVMAALGNDTAVRLLEPELTRFHYASNLLAARRVIDDMRPNDWNATAYNRWLGALRTLDDPPAPKAEFPEVMRRDAWQRKQLRASLASWAELRHDTVLYAKQSYTAYSLCEYPIGFVEPYPAFFQNIQGLAASLADRFAKTDVPLGDRERSKLARQLQSEASAFFRRFAEITGRLGALATKELASQPFTKEESEFLKKAIDVRGGGSGPPEYDGWYPELIRGAPEKHAPVVADVHSDPTNGKVLEAAVGDAEFLIVAVNNGPHRAAYVGPAFSYYEFTGPIEHRMTDEEWGDKLASADRPERPIFTRKFAPLGTERELKYPPVEYVVEDQPKARKPKRRPAPKR